MKNKEIKILSPLTILSITALDLSVIAVTIFAIIKLKQEANLFSITFGLMDILAIAIAILVSKEVVSNKVVFTEYGIEFIGLDNDNKYLYSDIEKIDYQRDDKASFKKNFNDRHSFLILNLKDNKIASIDLGLVSKKTLLKIVDEIESNLTEQ